MFLVGLGSCQDDHRSEPCCIGVGDMSGLWEFEVHNIQVLLGSKRSTRVVLNH